jgi:two-component system chemotaxis sensor kinase CheA
VNDRRRAILGKFRAGAAERLDRLAHALGELARGRDVEPHTREIARELHTLKGESNMLGLPRVGQVIHAMETALAGAPETCASMSRGLHLVGLAIQERLPDEEQALAGLVAELQGGPPGSAPAPLPRIEEPPPRAPGGTAPRSRLPPSRPLAADLWMRVEAAKVDALCDKLNGLIVELGAVSTKLRAPNGPQARREATARRVLRGEVDRCRAELGEISEIAWALRVEPVEPALEELARYAQELAVQQGKRLRVEIRAGRAAVERSVLDGLRDPLLHLVRNAVDHGIETPCERGGKAPEATLTLTAEQLGAHVVIAVSDDGRGVDPERIRSAAVARGLLDADEAEEATTDGLFDLLFLHGFSTRSTVTDLSGRGVGLDVVREKVEALGGTISLESEVRRGSRFALTVPATVGRDRCLMVEHDGIAYGMPSRSIAEIVDVRATGVETAGGRRGLRLRGGAVPLRSLARTLGEAAATAEPWAVVLDLAGHRWAFGVHRILGERELLRRPIDPLLQRLGYLAASSVLDDGRLVLVLSLPGLVRRPETPALLAPAPPPQPRRRVLVVDDAAVMRSLLGDMLGELGVDVEAAASGQAALTLVAAAEPDVMVTDVDMPGMNGWELVRTLRKQSRRFPIVMLSARSSPEDRARAFAAGADAYLVKSQSLGTALVDTVGALVRRATTAVHRAHDAA